MTLHTISYGGGMAGRLAIYVLIGMANGRTMDWWWGTSELGA